MNTTQLLQLTASSVEIQAADPTVAGDAKPLPRFRMVAYTGGPMRVAGWRYPVIVDLAGLAIPSQNRPIRFGHDAAHGVGHTDSIRTEAGQLLAAGVVSRDTPAAKEVVTSSKNGFPWQASIGAGVEEFEFVKDSQKVIVNGRTFEGPVNVVRKSTLGEISFVDLGADGNTSAQVAAASANFKESFVMDPVSAPAPQTSNATPAASAAAQAIPGTAAEAAGATPATVSAAPVVAHTPTVASPVAAQVVVRTSETSAAGGTAEQIRAEAAAETARIASIRTFCKGKFPEIESKAIAQGWDTMRTELEVLRARPTHLPPLRT